MNKQEFKEGQTVYDSAGNEYVFVASLERSTIVRPVVEVVGSDYEEIWEPGSATEVTFNLYAEPPRQRQETELAQIKQQIEENRAKLVQIQEAIIHAESEAKQRNKKIEKALGVKRLEDFIDGKFTHFVIGRYDVKTFEEAIVSKEEDWKYNKDRKFRLLTLFGRSRGDLQWKVNEYSDGSGYWTEAVPCFSEIEARAIVQDRIEEDCQKWIQTRCDGWSAAKVAASAGERLGLVVPEVVLAEIRTEKRQQLAAEIEAKKLNVKRLTSELEALQSEMAVTP